ncbi:nitric oxide synthase oxygenase [Streptacidiphilus sp. PB12-B1b]|nr:nitric oxide synthase oxygenase [Streptacidiphilus sp. PB12-B1b]
MAVGADTGGGVAHKPVPTAAGAGDSSAEAVLAAAEEFVRHFDREGPVNGETGYPDGVEARLREVRAAVSAHGSYEHTPEELTFGARVAWRNSARCIGRLYWHSLTVRDLRWARHPDDIAEQCSEHLRLATNKGRIRPVVSVFAPDRPGRPAARILSPQLVHYTDDPDSARLLARARDLGWQGGKEPFDLMPLLVQAAPYRRPEHYDLPPDAVLEVPLSHPHHAGFADLGLRWYAVPAVSDMTLEIGGISYPAAPFNGWYMGTEIGSRDLGDVDRYDLLPAVAELFELDTSSPRKLWRDRALVELNLAVLHSYQDAGVTISDHHTESVRFLAHIERERRHGRPVPSEWSWIVPPLSGSATAVFHRTFDPPDPKARPAYLRRSPTDPWGPAL